MTQLPKQTSIDILYMYKDDNGEDRMSWSMRERFIDKEVPSGLVLGFLLFSLVSSSFMLGVFIAGLLA